MDYFFLRKGDDGKPHTSVDMTVLVDDLKFYAEGMGKEVVSSAKAEEAKDFMDRFGEFLDKTWAAFMPKNDKL